MFYKPIGVDTDMSPGSELLSLVSHEVDRRKYHHVGRLDRDTSGLLLFSRNGDLTFSLLNSPTLSKSYLAQLGCSVTSLELRKLLDGVVLADGPAKALHAEIVSESDPQIVHLFLSPNYRAVFPINNYIRIVVCEGRNRIVRRMLASVGLPVLALHRERFGPVQLVSSARPGDLVYIEEFQP